MIMFLIKLLLLIVAVISGLLSAIYYLVNYSYKSKSDKIAGLIVPIICILSLLGILFL